MAKRLSTWFGIASFVVVCAGCGSSGSSSTGVTTAAATTATTANARLTSAQWAEYTSSRAALRKANAVATATLSKCSAGASVQQPKRTQACVGNTFTELTHAAGDSLATLKGFAGTVSGACATALAQLTNQVGTFQASAAQMQRTIDSPTLAGYPAASNTLELALNGGRTEAKKFDAQCAPL